jgi:hypothetical protein
MSCHTVRGTSAIAGKKENYVCRLGIPVKVNAVPEGFRTAFQSEGEQQSERSEAGMVIVGVSVRNRQARSSEAKRRSFQAGIGVRAASPFPKIRFIPASHPVEGFVSCAWIRRVSRCDGRCEPDGRGCHRLWWDHPVR